MSDNKLSQWLRREIYQQRKGNSCRAITLRHMPLGSRSGQEVFTWEIDLKRDATEEGLAGIVGEVISMAETDAQGVGGTQTYVLLSYHGKTEKDQKEKSSARYTFRMNGDADDDDGNYGSSEPASAKGQLAQLMRHNEGIMKTALLGLGNLMQASSRMLNTTMERNTALEIDRVKTLELVRDMMLDKHSQEMDEKALLAKQDNQKQIMGAVNTLMPVVKAKLLGTPLSADEHPALDMVKAFASSLDAKQKATILSALKPEQAALLGALLQPTDEHS